jgi:cell division protein FtsA
VKNGGRIVGGIDVGTTKVSAIIGERRGAGVRIIGIGTAPSQGLKQGVIVDIDKASQSIGRAVREATRMAGTSVRRYNVGVAGEHILSMNSRGVVGVGGPNGEITREDVARSLDAAAAFSLPASREILHALPQQYVIDNQQGIRDPVGMYGTRLEARVHVVTALRSALDNIARALENCHLEIDELILEPLASSRAALTAEEREIGVMLLDIGGGTTDVIIHRDVGVVASGIIGIGGNNVTSDVAYGLRTAVKNAETIKIEHGCALTSMVSHRDQIHVPGIGFREERKIAKHFLAGIIEPRVTELFSLVNDQIATSGCKRTLGAGVVLTGGSSMLSGIRELAEQVFDLPVRVGGPLGVEGLSEVIGHPRYATGVGLLLYGGASSMGRLDRFSAAAWWKQSFGQLRKAIASFI